METCAKFVTGKVRLGYANVWEPRTAPGSGKAKYSAVIIISKADTETLRRVNAAVDAAIGNGKYRLEDAPKEELNLPLKDGDKDYPVDPTYRNTCYIYASSILPPTILDADLRPIKTRKEVYSGIYAKVSLEMYPFSDGHTKGIACGLGNIQKVADGELLGTKRSAAKEFMEDKNA